MGLAGLAWAALLALSALAAEPPARGPETGFRPEVRVHEATRLDWEFAARALGPGPARLPTGYESRRQRYQLFVPPSYKPTRAWPLVLFVSPGDDPLGWRKPCEDGEALFCAAYGAGNNALLEWVAARCDRTEAAERAGKLLREIRVDRRKGKLLGEQAAVAARRLLAAEASARERAGPVALALEAWGRLARAYPDSPEGKRARAALARLSAALASTPYLGASFAGDTTAVLAVVAGSPAHRAGLRPGDRLVQLGPDKVGSLPELRRALEAHKPGDRLALDIRRAGKPLTLTVQVGAPPAVRNLAREGGPCGA
jgi:hypothetical protein